MKDCKMVEGIKVCKVDNPKKHTMSIKEVRKPSNYTVWGGYMETPVSFNPLGDRWLFNLEGVDGRALVANERNMRRAIKDNEDYIAEILESEGYEVTD